MGLKWEKVDFDNNRVKIDKALVSSKSRGVFEESTKTSDIRYLTLPMETMDLLRLHKLEQLRLQLANGDRWIHTGYVFTQDNGDHMNPDSITGWLKDFSARHGLPHINPHAFRYTFATTALEHDMDVKTLSAIIGHIEAFEPHGTLTEQLPAEDGKAPVRPPFAPYKGKVRKPGTGGIYELNGHLYEGRYSPTNAQGRREVHTFYAKTREECEALLEKMIVEL